MIIDQTSDQEVARLRRRFRIWITICIICVPLSLVSFFIWVAGGGSDCAGTVQECDAQGRKFGLVALFFFIALAASFIRSVGTGMKIEAMTRAEGGK